MLRVRRFLNSGLPFRLVIPLLLIPFLGITARPHEFDLKLQQAARALKGNSPLSAATNIAESAEYFPWRGDLWELAGRLAAQGNDPASAIQFLTKAQQVAQLSAESKVALGDSYRARGDLAAAVQVWQQAPRNSEILSRLLQAHLDLKDYPSAVHDLNSLLAENPGDASLNFQLGLILTAIEPQGASAYLAQAGALDPKLADQAASLQRMIQNALFFNEPAYTDVMIGRALGSIDQWVYAAEAFRRATSARPDYAEAWAFLGEALQHSPQVKSDPSAGFAELEEGWKLDPNSLSVNTFLALYWKRQGRDDVALTYLRRAASLEPKNQMIQAEIGDTLTELGDLPSAQAYYQQAAQSDPSNPVYWKLLAGFCLIHQTQISQIALPASRQAVLLSPNDPEALDLMGQTLVMLQDYSNGERFLTRALQLDPNYAPAHLHLGMVYLLQGDVTDAHQELSLAQNLLPNSSTGDQAQRLLDQYFP
jgi:tetratricopeptide (TPR) repeat protein